MKTKKIREIAEAKGVFAGDMNRTDLIRAVQRAEGYSSCYSSRDSDCPEMNCLWRNDCLRDNAKTKRL